MKPQLERRTFIMALLCVPALGVLAACGSDGDTLQTSTTSPDPTSPDPSVADPVVTTPEVVLSYTEPGGFTTAEFAFQDPPLAIITGDGRLITAAVIPAVYPGPLLPQHMVRTISDSGISAVLSAAAQSGLLADVEYANNELIADASTATLSIEAGGVTYLHEAPALGLGGLGSPNDAPQSKALADFLTMLTGGIEEFAGAENLGEPTSYVPDAYQFRAVPLDDVASFDLEPTLAAWPDGTGIALADAGDCVEVARELVGDLFDRADQLTFFVEAERTYQLSVRPAYPGRTC